jgi:hypothetical protein
MPTQESWLPLSSTIIGSRLISNAFAESVENLEEGEGTSANQDNDGNGDNNEPSVEGNDNNNGKNDNDDGKEQEDGGGAVGEEDDDISKGQVPTDRQNQEVLNHAPKANAGANQEVNEGEEVTLSAKDSADEDGDSLTFSWRQLMSGNSGEDISIELKDSKSSEARFTAPLIEGHDNEVDTKVVLRFELTASDGEFEDKDSVEITIRDNERNDESEKLQEGAGTTDGNEDNINNNEQNENRNEPMTDNANPDPAGGETIGNMDNASSSVPPPSLSSGNPQNNTQNILPKEPTIIENDDKQLNGTSEIVNQDTDNNSSTETGATLSSLSLTCGPMPVKVIQGGEGMLTCDIRNPTIYDFDLIITCSGLEDARIGCFVEGSHIKSTISLDRMSDKTFPITIASYQSPLPSIGSYEFMILAECNIDSCGKS